jgi:hypothetical protein
MDYNKTINLFKNKDKLKEIQEKLEKKDNYNRYTTYPNEKSFKKNDYFIKNEIREILFTKHLKEFVEND